jgi:hypothetical protein
MSRDDFRRLRKCVYIVEDFYFDGRATKGEAVRDRRSNDIDLAACKLLSGSCDDAEFQRLCFLIDRTRRFQASHLEVLDAAFACACDVLQVLTADTLRHLDAIADHFNGELERLSALHGGRTVMHITRTFETIPWSKARLTRETARDARDARDAREAREGGDKRQKTAAASVIDLTTD